MKSLKKEIRDQSAHVLMISIPVALCAVHPVLGVWMLAIEFILERERIQHGWAFWEWGSGAKLDIIFGLIGLALGTTLWMALGAIQSA